MNKHLRLFLALLVSMAGVLTGTDYYVDVNKGNDLNSGLSLLAPWKTLKPANNKALAGDVIYLSGGVYSQESDQYHGLIHPTNSGTVNAPIIYKAIDGETPVLTGCYQPILFANPNSEYIIVDGITVDGGNRDTSLVDIFAMMSGNHNTIQNCTLTNATDNVDGGVRIYGNYNKVLNCKISHAGCYNLGDVWVEGTYNLVEGCTIFDIGHDTMNLFGHHNIVRNNDLSNPIYRVADAAHSIGPERSYLVFDGNRVHGSPIHGAQANSPYQIIRRNVVYDNAQHGMGLYGGQPNMGGSSNSFIYNNTLYKNGGVAIKLNQNGSSCVDVVMKNNISYKNVGGFSQYEGVNPANQHEINNFNGNPYFADEGNNDFHLIFGSPCIDAGAFLTNTRQAGSGTTILVENAGYFIDGFGIVEGDIIQLQGQTQTAKIISVDYSGNTLSINGFLEWTSGQGVSLAYSGSAPDIGAFEYESSVPPQLSAVIEANSTSGQPPLNVTFTGSATGGTAPYSYSWNFGDGQTSTSQNPSHTYASEGDYTATLTVTDNQGANAVASQVITVTKTAPLLAVSIAASKTSGPAPLKITFSAKLKRGIRPKTYSWSFGDGKASSASKPTHKYTLPGTYTARLTLSDSKGARGSASVIITARSKKS
jgi:PKD repeat protein